MVFFPYGQCFFFVKTELFITKINKTIEIQNSTEIYGSTVGQNFIESLLYLSRSTKISKTTCFYGSYTTEMIGTEMVGLLKCVDLSRNNSSYNVN